MPANISSIMDSLLFKVFKQGEFDENTYGAYVVTILDKADPFQRKELVKLMKLSMKIIKGFSEIEII